MSQQQKLVHGTKGVLRSLNALPSSRIIVVSLFFLASTSCAGEEQVAATSEKEMKQPRQSASNEVASSKMNKIQSKIDRTRASIKGIPAKKEDSSSASNITQAKQEKASSQQASSQTDDVTLERVKNETSEAIAVADAFLQQEENRYHEKIEAELTAFNRRVERLQERASSAATHAKEKVSKELAALRSQMNVTGNQLGAFNERSENELQTLSKELQDILSVLNVSTAGSEGSTGTSENSAESDNSKEQSDKG